jgi:hypothetical protein
MLKADRVLSTPPTNTSVVTPTANARPFYGAECLSYPNCSGGCGLGCTKEHDPIAPAMALISQTEGDSKMTHESSSAVSGGISCVSRRSIMNMLVSTAIAGTAVPALAAEVTDPIFAAIERHRAGHQAHIDALMALDRLYETVPEEVRRSPRVQFGRKDGGPNYLHSHKQIDDRLEWMPDFGATPEIRARLHNELDHDIREWRTKRDEHGVTSAELRVEQVCLSSNELAWAIATTVPTSFAGVAAVLRYANEWEDTGEDWPDTDTIGSEGWHYQLRQTLAGALQILIARGGA